MVWSIVAAEQTMDGSGYVQQNQLPLRRLVSAESARHDVIGLLGKSNTTKLMAKGWRGSDCATEEQESTVSAWWLVQFESVDDRKDEEAGRRSLDPGKRLSCWTGRYL